MCESRAAGTIDTSTGTLAGEAASPSPAGGTHRAKEGSRSKWLERGGAKPADHPAELQLDAVPDLAAQAVRNLQQKLSSDTAGPGETSPRPYADNSLVPSSALAADPQTVQMVKCGRRALALTRPGLSLSAYRICAELLTFEECMALLSGKAGTLADSAVDLVEARFRDLVSF